ncbi:MAG: sterol desaturase family protein [Alphaproteobacteria bacterium]|nr:sterol desaturase family protein [Alphaproteobacteria bacterium]
MNAVRAVIAWVEGVMATPLGVFTFLTVSGFLFYMALAGVSYLVFFVWGRERYNPDFVPDWALQRSAMLWGLISIAGNAAFMTPLHWLGLRYSRVYWDVGEHGWWWVPVSVLLLLVLSETAVYWVHRALHWPWLFKHVHIRHHSWRHPTPWVGVAFHPLDSFAQALPHHLFAFLFPIHGVVYTVSVAMLTMWAVAIHDRVSLFRFRWLNYTGHHTIHHFYNNYNFGQYTTFWDRWCGTWKEPEGERFLRPAAPWGRRREPVRAK